MFSYQAVPATCGLAQLFLYVHVLFLYGWLQLQGFGSAATFPRFDLKATTSLMSINNLY